MNHSQLMQQKGASISTLMEDIGLWEEREAIAKKLYDASTANDPVLHCNRFPAWSELKEKSRKPWRAKAHKQMIATPGVPATQPQQEKR